jgi:WD40 repeat protein
VRTTRGALLAEIDTGRGKTQPRAAVFAPGEREIAVAGLNQLEIWSREGKRVATVPVGEILIWDVAWSPDGSQLAFAGNRGALVDRATLAERPLVGHPGRVNRVQFSRDGSRLLTAGDQTARIWDVATAKQLAQLDHPAKVIGAIWDRANARIFTSSTDGKVRIWDPGGKLLDELDVGTRYLDLSLSPDEHRLALGGHDATIAIWDLETRARIVEALGHTGPVTSVAWSPDGALLASSADDQTARVWDPQTGKLLATRRHRDGAMSVVWTADGTAILTASTDASIRLWDAHRDRRSVEELRWIVDAIR